MSSSIWGSLAGRDLGAKDPGGGITNGQIFSWPSNYQRTNDEIGITNDGTNLAGLGLFFFAEALAAFAADSLAFGFLLGQAF